MPNKPPPKTPKERAQEVNFWMRKAIEDASRRAREAKKSRKRKSGGQR